MEDNYSVFTSLQYEHLDLPARRSNAGNLVAFGKATHQFFAGLLRKKAAQNFGGHFREVGMATSQCPGHAKNQSINWRDAKQTDNSILVRTFQQRPFYAKNIFHGRSDKIHRCGARKTENGDGHRAFFDVFCPVWTGLRGPLPKRVSESSKHGILLAGGWRWNGADGCLLRCEGLGTRQSSPT